MRQASQMVTVKWFNPTKWFGFIKPDKGRQDVFLLLSVQLSMDFKCWMRTE